MAPSREVTPSWSPSRSQQCPAAITPTERQGGVCGYVTRTQRLPSSEEAIVQPSVTRQHKKRRPQSVEQKQREEKNDPKSRQHLHAWRASCSRVSISARDAKGVTPSPSHSCRALCNYLFLCVRARWKSREKKKHREANQHSKRHSRTAAMHAVRHNLNNHTRWQHTPSTKTKKKQKKHGGRVCGCVWRCGCLPSLAAIKTNKRGKEMCAPPHRPSSHAHTSRLPQRAVRRGPSSCVQQARRTGPSSRACRWCASGAVGREHTAPLTGRVQQQTIKEGRVEKKTSTVIAPKRKEECGSER
ncbi:hypothetical protein TCSYLVIO_008420 [Trypanosoma cruzi]|nr:hypothetical protein TCSYLVIO_008420 [Trypanosoma cruzi]